MLLKKLARFLKNDVDLLVWICFVNVVVGI